MREARIKHAAQEALELWFADRLAAPSIACRQECRTVDGAGRADVVVAARSENGPIVTAVCEAKSRFVRGALAALRVADGTALTTGAALQVLRYPANYRVLACPENLLADHPGDRGLLVGLCERDGIGLLAVNWYREFDWLVQPRHVDTPLLWPDCLDGYAAGSQLRERLDFSGNVADFPEIPDL